MSLGTNIGNAFHVVVKTYENISKLITYCQTACEKESHYTQPVSKFLRYRSDQDFHGWLIQEFFILFQDKKDKLLRNGWRDGPVYALEINLTEEHEPLLLLSCFEYKAIRKWFAGCSPANYGVFFHPLRDKQLIHTEVGDIKILTMPDTKEITISKDYWGLKRVLYKTLRLADITVENVVDTVFGTFDELKANK